MNTYLREKVLFFVYEITYVNQTNARVWRIS